MKRLIVGAFAVAVIVIGMLLIWRGGYGLTMFVFLPLAIGALGAAVGAATTRWQAVGWGAFAGFISCFSLLMLGLEGFACVLMAMPLVVPLAALGGAMYYTAIRTGSSAPSAAMAILPLATLGFDTTATPPTYEVHSSIEIAAPPERVWPNVVSFGDLADPTEWYFRTGLAYPTRTRIEGRGVGATRYCEFSTGPVVEPVRIWDEPRLLQFDVVTTPAPMREWSPYGEVHPKHLDGYMRSKRGQFKLIPLANGRTLLEGTSWYQHGLYPAGYWRIWSDAIVHRIHMRVFSHIKNLSER